VEARLTGCPKQKSHTFTIKPQGFQDALEVTVDFACGCACEAQAEPDSPMCNQGNGTYGCGVCQCHAGRLGPHCECSEGDYSLTDDANCSPDPQSPACGGRGDCVCGQCVCHRNDYGQVWGKFCECDDFSCLLFKGKQCSGEGLSFSLQ